MKKTFLAIFMGVLVVTSCEWWLNSNRNNNDADDEWAEEADVQLDDEADTLVTTIYSYKYNQDKVEVNFQIEYPTGGCNKILRNAIREFISEYFGGTYEGSLNDGQELVNFYGQKNKARLKEMREDDSVDMDEDYINGYWRNVEVNKIFETDKLITFGWMEDIYYNGAHGNPAYYGITFRKSDGRRFSKEMMTNIYSEEWYSIVKEGLRNYFSNDGNVAIETDEDLKEYILTDDNVNNLPLPQNPPYVTEDGVKFTYQPYEISFYAAGMPEFTVSKADMRPFLNVTAKRMLE